MPRFLFFMLAIREGGAVFPCSVESCDNCLKVKRERLRINQETPRAIRFEPINTAIFEAYFMILNNAGGRES